MGTFVQQLTLGNVIATISTQTPNRQYESQKCNIHKSVNKLFFQKYIILYTFSYLFTKYSLKGISSCIRFPTCLQNTPWKVYHLVYVFLPVYKILLERYIILYTFSYLFTKYSLKGISSCIRFLSCLQNTPWKVYHLVYVFLPVYKILLERYIILYTFSYLFTKYSLKGISSCIRFPTCLQNTPWKVYHLVYVFFPVYKILLERYIILYTFSFLFTKYSLKGISSCIRFLSCYGHTVQT